MLGIAAICFLFDVLMWLKKRMSKAYHNRVGATRIACIRRCEHGGSDYNPPTLQQHLLAAGGVELGLSEYALYSHFNNQGDQTNQSGSTHVEGCVCAHEIRSLTLEEHLATENNAGVNAISGPFLHQENVFTEDSKTSN